MTPSHTPAVDRTKLKVCCIADADELRLAAELGADAVGFVSDEMPSGPGTISHALITELARLAPPGLDTFLLTCRTSADAIIELAKQCGTTTVQLCDAIDDAPAAYATIRAALPSVRLVQVIHVEDELALDEAFNVQGHVDALLLDSGRPKAAVKELGGTGRAHDWTISRRIVGMASVPVWLAGGLNPSNIPTAIRDVGPHGLDVCSGCRTNGILDEGKVRAIFTQVSTYSR